jgi:hypothetical protein
MITMIDEIYDRHYREARADLNAALTHALGRLGNAIHDAFDVLVRIEYSAPWAAKAKRVRSH